MVVSQQEGMRLRCIFVRRRYYRPRLVCRAGDLGVGGQSTPNWHARCQIGNWSVSRGSVAQFLASVWLSGSSSPTPQPDRPKKQATVARPS